MGIPLPTPRLFTEMKAWVVVPLHSFRKTLLVTGDTGDNTDFPESISALCVTSLRKHTGDSPPKRPFVTSMPAGLAPVTPRSRASVPSVPNRGAWVGTAFPHNKNYDKNVTQTPIRAGNLSVKVARPAPAGGQGLPSVSSRTHELAGQLERLRPDWNAPGRFFEERNLLAATLREAALAHVPCPVAAPWSPVERRALPTVLSPAERERRLLALLGARERELSELRRVLAPVPAPSPTPTPENGPDDDHRHHSSPARRRRHCLASVSHRIL